MLVTRFYCRVHVHIAMCFVCMCICACACVCVLMTLEYLPPSDTNGHGFDSDIKMAYDHHF